MLVLRHGGCLRAMLKSTIRDSARKDLESLAVHMPNLPDTDAKTLALRMSPLGAFLCPSVAQVRSAPCDALCRGFQLDDAWSYQKIIVYNNSFLMKFIVKW